MLVLGIDDAGRGPVLGNMFLAGVLIKQEDESFLKSEGVMDSKQLSHPVRIKLAGIIRDAAISFNIVSSTPEQIDHAINSGINLNTLEAIKAGEIINTLIQGRKEMIRVIVDCPSVNTKAWRKTLFGCIKNPENIELFCEHKADVNYPSVSAASILAKVAREEDVARLKEKYGKLGSGYPSDPDTISFLKKEGKKLRDSGIFRKTWATWKNLFPSAEQVTLSDF